MDVGERYQRHVFYYARPRLSLNKISIVKLGSKMMNITRIGRAESLRKKSFRPIAQYLISIKKLSLENISLGYY